MVLLSFPDVVKLLRVPPAAPYQPWRDFYSLLDSDDMSQLMASATVESVYRSHAEVTLDKHICLPASDITVSATLRLRCLRPRIPVHVEQAPSNSGTAPRLIVRPNWQTFCWWDDPNQSGKSSSDYDAAWRYLYWAQQHRITLFVDQAQIMSSPVHDVSVDQLEPLHVK